jgi:phthalate 4,5-cis-dihydrodiol dehydrogenase
MVVPAVAAMPNMRLVAGADVNPRALDIFRERTGAKTYDSIEALCDDAEVEAVWIATPTTLHCPHVILAAERGKHVIVEKPMALTVDECAVMVDAAERAGVVLVVGHTHGFDPAILRMRELIESGEVGRVRMITNVVYTDFLYRPRRPEELDTSLGGGIMYNQVPHQIEIVRTLAGSAVRSVKAIAGAWDPRRPTEGALAALLDFEDDVAASLVYSGYDRFDSDEFHFWVGESGQSKRPAHGAARRALRAANSPEDEARMKAESGFSGRGVRAVSSAEQHQPHFGFLLVSCEGADLRPSADGVLVYGDDGVRELALPAARAFPNKDNVPGEFYDAVTGVRPALHDGRWGMETVRVALALLESARSRREIQLYGEGGETEGAAPRDRWSSVIER